MNGYPMGSGDGLLGGEDLPPDAIDWIRANPSAAQAAIAAIQRPLVHPRPITAVPTGPLPRSILSMHGQPGACLTAGTVTVLAGQGGTAKSTLSRQLAMGAASLPDGVRGSVGEYITATGGPVLLVTWEDDPAFTSRALHNLAAHMDGGTDGPSQAALDRVYLMDMTTPIFGPPADGGSYNRRPGTLDGWVDLERAITRLRPVLIIVDPALAAYVGTANDVPPVREFHRGVSPSSQRCRCRSPPHRSQYEGGPSRCRSG